MLKRIFFITMLLHFSTIMAAVLLSPRNQVSPSRHHLDIPISMPETAVFL